MGAVATGGVATGGGADASRLHLSVLGPTGAPVIMLRVDKVEFWTLENITVLQSPDGSQVGAFFPHVNAAMGQLKKFLPHSNAANYIELLQVYVVGALDEAVLGKREIRFKLYGESVSTRHSPELLTAPVRCLEAEPLEGGGRWLPVAVLRPFAPAHLPDGECISRMKELMRQVCVERRGRGSEGPLLTLVFTHRPLAASSLVAPQDKHIPFVRPQFRCAPAGAAPTPVTGAKRPLPAGFEGFQTVAELMASEASGGAIASAAAGTWAAHSHLSTMPCPSSEAATEALAAPSDPRSACRTAEGGAKPRGRKRDKYFDKKGNVVVARQQGDMELAYWPTCLVIVGKQQGAPKGGSNSPRYVLTEGIRPSASPDLWHITEVQPLPEVLPAVWRAYCDGRFTHQGGKQRMLEAMVWAVQKQNAASPSASHAMEQTWDWLVPEAAGRWKELLAAAASGAPAASHS